MASRQQYHYPVGGRAATFNPARASMPSVGYGPLYQDDIHVFPVPVPSLRPAPSGARYHHGHSSSVSRAPPLPYFGADDPRAPRAREGTAAPRGHRSSTLDSTATRPIIITTTTGAGRPHAPSSGGRSGSPIRNDYRASEDALYAQPASSIRSRSANRTGGYSPVLPPDDFMRSARDSDGYLAPGRSDAYRSSRPSVVYPSNPRHTDTAIDVGDDYGYTKPSDLVRYDLDHPRQSRSRRESMDMYQRPNVYYNPERRGFNVETNRTYDSNGLGRSFDNRGGPPPTTRGFDRIRYDPLAVPPPAPAPPSLEVPPSPRERRGSNRHNRPVSLHQDDYYRTREDETNHRQIRDLEQESQRHHQQDFHDDQIMSRGFGVRTETFPLESDDRRDRDGNRDRRNRREPPRRDYVEPPRRSDESLEPVGGRDGDYDTADRRKSRQKPPAEHSRERRTSKDDDEDDRKGFRDNLKAGLGIAATAVGLGPVVKEKVGKDEDDKKHHRRESDEIQRDSSDDVEIVSSRAAHRYRSGDKEYIPRDRRERPQHRPELSPDREEAKAKEEARERHRRAAEARLNGGGERGESSKRHGRDSSESDGDRPSGRHRAAFNPNDTNSLKEIKDRLAAVNLEKEKEKPGKDKVILIEPPAEPRKSSPREPSSEKRRDDDSRGRELVPPAHEERQVRVVSPPRDKTEAKPIKGILKQPSAKFPEDPNPIREGVAPHKKDEKLKEVPVDARWTKISRKIVNPEALTIGQERFEVRDDFVVVLRVLSKEDIQTYAAATAALRERRREAAERDRGREQHDDDHDDDKKPPRHRHHKDRDRDYGDEDEDEGGRKHRRRRNHDEEDEEDLRRHDVHYHRRHRDKDRESAIED